MPRSTPPSRISYTEIPYNLTTSPRTFASISWQTGDVIVVLMGSEGSGAITAPTVAGLTFAPQQVLSTAGVCNAAVYTAVAASNGSGTISCGVASANTWGASAWVWRGSDGVGSSGISGTPTATKTINVTPTDTHSAWMWGIFDFSATVPGTTVGAPTPTNTDESAQETAGSYSAFAYDLVDQASSAQTAYGISGGTSSGTFSIVSVEVLGTTGGGSPSTFPPTNVTAPMRARYR